MCAVSLLAAVPLWNTMNALNEEVCGLDLAVCLLRFLLALSYLSPKTNFGGNVTEWRVVCGTAFEAKAQAAYSAHLADSAMR